MPKPYGGTLIDRVLAGVERDKALERADRLKRPEISEKTAKSFFIVRSAREW